MQFGRLSRSVSITTAGAREMATTGKTLLFDLNCFYLGILLGWQQWVAWSQCSHSCGQGFRMRTRGCVGTCEGDSTQTESCISSVCAGVILSIVKAEAKVLLFQKTLLNGWTGVPGPNAQLPVVLGRNSGLGNVANLS